MQLKFISALSSDSSSIMAVFRILVSALFKRGTFSYLFLFDQRETYSSGGMFCFVHLLIFLAFLMVPLFPPFLTFPMDKEKS